MKKSFELTPELFKKLLEGDKESFIAKFSQEYYLSALAIECIFPLLPDDEARKEFFLAGELPEKTDGVLDALNSWFSAFDFLFENKKCGKIIQLGHIEGARYLYQKGLKDYLVEYAREHEDDRWAIVWALYDEHAWLLLEGFEKEVGRLGGFLRVSGVLAVQEKHGKNIKDAMPVVYQGSMDYIGGHFHPADIYNLLTDQASCLERGNFPAWFDWGKIPDAKVLLIWYYKNIGDERFKAEVVQLFAQDGEVSGALKDPNFPTKLAEIEKALLG